MNSKNKTLLRAASAFIAGSLVGCAPAGLINQIRVAGQAGPSFDLNRPSANAGEVNFVLRWPGVSTRQAQAIPGSANAVVAIVWKDSARTTAAAVHTFRKNSSETRFNGQTGRYESYGRMILPTGEGYVMELKAYDVDPQYREVSTATPVAQLICGPEATPSADTATSSTGTATTSTQTSTDSTSTATESTTASESATATESATASTQVSPCTVTAKILASGESAPFKVQAGFATPLRILLSATNGPEITSLSNKIVPAGGTSLTVYGKNFGSDPSKLRATLVPAYAGWGNPMELSASDVSSTSFKVQIPQGAFSGTVYAFVDGLEASASSAVSAFQVVRRVFVTSDNLKFDLKPQGCTTCEQSDKVYAVANATVSLKVFGEEATPWGMGGNYNPGDPNSVPQGAVPLSPSILKVEPAGSTTATPSVSDAGNVVFPGNGTWVVRNKAGLEQNWTQAIYAGTYNPGTGMFFARDQWNPSSIVSALVPGLAESWFGYQSGVANQAQPIPNAKLGTSGGNLDLTYKDFDWAISPADALNVTQDGRYTMTHAKRQDVTFTGTLKLDPSKQITKILKTGITLAVTPNEAYVSQNVTGSNPALTKQQFYLLFTAGNGATTSSVPSCPGCGSNIPATQYSWSSGNPELLSIDSGGLATSIPGLTTTGDVSVSAALTLDPDAFATASVHVTDNGGLALDIQ